MYLPVLAELLELCDNAEARNNTLMFCFNQMNVVKNIHKVGKEIKVSISHLFKFKYVHIKAKLRQIYTYVYECTVVNLLRIVFSLILNNTEQGKCSLK